MRYAELIEALHIFAKCETKGLDAHLAGAEHDVIYARYAEYDEKALEPVDVEAYLEEHGEYPAVDDSRLSAEDNARLRELGWCIEVGESDLWMRYV